MSKEIKLQIRVSPNAKKTQILSEQDNILKIAIKSPAHDNKANLELIKFLKKHTGKHARILSGITSKNKIVMLSD